MKSPIIWVLFTVLVIGLTACTPAYQTEGVRVSLAPVTYKLSLSAKSSTGDTSFDEFIRFVSHHQSLILTQPIHLNYSSKAGAKKTVKARNYLLAQGVDKNNIHEKAMPLGESDWQVALRSYQVQTESCDPVTIADIHPKKSGCVLTHNQWLSKVHPEKGVSAPDTSHEQGNY
ncbi:hypothetical protein [Salinivibrio sp. ES.052]|uniref:hypothetical protein n=1 Tax=Salinivibrio sp. ES.052 TaxID=1882823 RepID=UPI0009265D62|nr:hypothetical protein [Salinivibrio sp. ES.052]SIN72696.1 hypothetical protein SAMN05444724_0056 [Salinivibrio sp. ES.052]